MSSILDSNKKNSLDIVSFIMILYLHYSYI